MSELANQVADRLTDRQQKIVFAESCTAGLVAATLAAVPGISRWLCGSIVTYRESMKMKWLGVSEAALRQHTAVSQPVTEQMVAGVMMSTDEADIAAAVTGHLGPEAPASLDGVIFVSIASRNGDGTLKIETHRHQLRSPGRIDRRREAVNCVLEDLVKMLR